MPGDAHNQVIQQHFLRLPSFAPVQRDEAPLYSRRTEQVELECVTRDAAQPGASMPRLQPLQSLGVACKLYSLDDLLD